MDAEKVLRSRTAAVDSGHAIPAEAQRTTLDDLAAIVKTDYENNGRASGSEVERAFDRLRDHFGESASLRSVPIGKSMELGARG